MASTKNVQALNNRLDQACRNRVGEFYRQHITSLAQLEHDKLDTARLLHSVRKCPSDHEALSIKFLGPPPSSGHHHHHHQHQQQPRRDRSAGDHGKPRAQDPTAKQNQENQQQPPQQAQQRGPPPVTTAQLPVTVDNPFAPPPVHIPGLSLLERAKTFAGATTTNVVEASGAGNAAGGGGGRGGGSRRNHNRPNHRRSRTPFPNKLEKFYSHLEDTKRSCGLSVVDSTQTDEASQFHGTLSRAEWRLKLAKLDPEYYKNLAVDSDTTPESDSESD